MAEVILEDDWFECSICLETFDKNCKMLPCQHTFHKQCLQKLDLTNGKLDCPQCRRSVSADIESLPQNFLLFSLLEKAKPKSSVSEQVTSNESPPTRTRFTDEQILDMRFLPECKLPVKLSTNVSPMLNMGASGQKSESTIQPIHLSQSPSSDVPLKDVWRPTRLNTNIEHRDEEARKTEALYRSVLSILNKLTPEKLDILIDKCQALEIDSVARLKGVTDMILKKGISLIDETTGKEKTFRKCLINKCQQEFEGEKSAELDKVKLLAEIEAQLDPVTKKELQLKFEELQSKIRKKSVGFCRFLGELFKLQMITVSIMVGCATQLLGSLEDESLECLCALLTIIGKDVEKKKSTKLNAIFTKMQEIVCDKKNMVSSRIRFMLQDVIDLKKNKWIPRREADNPKTIDQMNQEFEKKEQDIKFANMLGPRSKQCEDYRRNNRDFKKNSKSDKNEQETVPPNKSNHNKTTGTYKFSKMSPGPRQSSMWRHGANSLPKATDRKPNSVYPTLSFGAKSSLIRHTQSNSTEKPRYFGMPNEKYKPKSSRNVFQSNFQSTASGQDEKDLLKRYCETILHELAWNENLEDSIVSFEERIDPTQVNDALECFIDIILEKVELINPCGKLFAALMKQKLIDLSNILNMLVMIEVFEDILIDIPHLWQYLAEALSPLFIEDCLKYVEFETALIEKLPRHRFGPFLLAIKDSLNEATKPSLPKYLLRNIGHQSFESIIDWINENVERSRGNPELVEAITRAIGEYFCSLSRDVLRNENAFRKIFVDKFYKYFKVFIENNKTLEVKCLETVVDLAIEKEFPTGFILNMYKSLFESMCVSQESFIQFKQHYHKKPAAAVLLSLNSFYQVIEELTF